MDEERVWHVIFRCRISSASGHSATFFRAYQLFALERGLFDWSGGREILAGLRLRGGDVWTALLTDEEGYAINNDGAEPPPPKAWI